MKEAYSSVEYLGISTLCTHICDFYHIWPNYAQPGPPSVGLAMTTLSSIKRLRSSASTLSMSKASAAVRTLFSFRRGNSDGSGFTGEARADE